MEIKPIPTPKNVIKTDEKYVFGKEVKMIIPDGVFSNNEEARLSLMWKNFTCSAGNLTFTHSSESGFFMKTQHAKSIPLGSGNGYVVNVSKTGLYCAAKDALSLKYAFFSLIELIFPLDLGEGSERFMIAGCEIHDASSISKRGVHLCVFPETTPLFLRRFISLAILLKFKYICIEFWGTWRFRAQPDFGWADRQFPKDEFADIVAMAREMGAEIIPMFNHLGHATGSRSYGRHATLDQNPRLATLFEPGGQCFCLSNPNLRDILAGVREELMEICGNGEYFHIGLDEAHDALTCPLCCDTDKNELFLDYVNSLSASVKSHGRRAMMWGDMILPARQFGRDFTAFSPDNGFCTVLDRLDHDIVMMDWQYDVNTTTDIKTTKFFIDQGFETWLCPYIDNENLKVTSIAAGELHSNYMVTTWDSLNDMTLKFAEISERVWNAPDRTPHGTKYSRHNLYVSDFMRKLCPPGCYDNSGVYPREVDVTGTFAINAY